jgi:hypothetical protein
MKEYRIKPVLVTKVLVVRMVYAFRILGMAAIIIILYTYYLHPRSEPYESWSEYFSSSAVRFLGILGLAAILSGVVWGLTMGKKYFMSLVITLHADHISWKAVDNKDHKIFFNDMLKQKDSIGLVIKSKSDKKITLMIPKQIDDFEELRNAIELNYSTNKL